VRVARTGQRVRLGPVTVTPVAATASDVFNLTSRFGEYGRLTPVNNDLFFAYSHYPTPPFEFETQVTTSGQASAGRFAWDSRRRIWLLYQDGTSVLEFVSDDDGLTWSNLGTPTSLLGAATTPDISLGWDGTLLRAWQKFSNSRIQFTLQAPGDATPGAATDVSLPGSGPVTFAGDSFRFVCDQRGWWHLHARPSGAGTTRIYTSQDDGASWATTSGAVTGLASGTHPGMCVGHDGTLWAFCYLGGNLKLSRRGPGDSAWSAFSTVQNDAAAALGVADAAASFAHAYEGLSRLLLACTRTGENQVSDSWTGDSGATVKRFT
jgi:hypothetical protein